MSDVKVAVIGLGYVGLPLAVACGRKYPTVGYDIKVERIEQLKAGLDVTKETSSDELESSNLLQFTDQVADIQAANFYIITVPTPVDTHNNPDLRPMIAATKMVAGILNEGDFVVYESTVFPGCTEEICVPILELGSGLKYNVDFFCGYSPERINPGDKKHRLENIVKVTSGSTDEALERIDSFYNSFISAGTYRAASIKVAEAAKVIENAQRDINIAFVNELSVIFERMNISTKDVLEAASTKWNFLKFTPGLVGGHCIGVDPYYLTYKASELGYTSQVILSGRRINDGMGEYVARRIVKMMSRENVLSPSNRVLIMGFSFKENCPDVRNTKVVDIYKELKDYNLEVDVYDPEVSSDEVLSHYRIPLINEVDFARYSVVLLAVGHEQFKTYDWVSIRKDVDIIFDLKGILKSDLVDSQL